MVAIHRRSLYAIALASSLMPSSIWAATSAELHLTGLQYTLTDNLTGQTSSNALILVPNTYYGPDGTVSSSARVWEAEPYVANGQNYDQSATVPLTPPGTISVNANLPRASASVLVQTSAGQTSIDALGQHSGDGTFSATTYLNQGSWGLNFGPSGQGLLLPAQTTITVSANVQGTAKIDGLCPLSTGLATEWCDSANAFSTLELDYVNPINHAYTNVGDEFNILLLTQAIGQAGQQTDSRLLSVSVTNTTDQAMQISFRYDVELNGRSVPAVVPEPSTWVMFSLGLIALGGLTVRTRRNRT